MKKFFFAFILLFLFLGLYGQTRIKLPGVYLIVFNNYPRSNENISFSLPYPFSDHKNVVLDSANTHQYLMKVPLISDSLLSEFIYYVMKPVSLDQAYKNPSHGTEIWYGLVTSNLRLDYSVIGIYSKNTVDSTNIYILTTYALHYPEKKRKANFSQYVGESLKVMLGKYYRRKHL
ncbi:MAG: hypothetical protein NT040_04065 [Bacteroidetes bacterium]|nr:hypothetical protein [Bacteroidota bacterium]